MPLLELVKSDGTLNQQETHAGAVPSGALGCVEQVTAVLLQHGFKSFLGGQAQQ